MKTVRVTISLPQDLLDRAKKARINISQAARVGLTKQLSGEETPLHSDLAERVDQLEIDVWALQAWRDRVKE